MKPVVIDVKARRQQKEINNHIEKILDEDGSLIQYYNSGSPHETKSNDALASVQNIPNNSSETWRKATDDYIDLTSLEGLFVNNHWVYTIDDGISTDVSSLQLLVVKEEYSDDGDLIYEKVINHPLMQLLQQPNSFQGYHTWMYNVTQQYIHMGNSINWYAEQSKELYVIPASNINIDRVNNDDALSMENLRYSLVSTSIDQDYLTTVKIRELPVSDLIHLRRPNPLNLIWGLSPWLPGRAPVLFNRNSDDYLNSFYTKGATPTLKIELENNVNHQQAVRQLRSFENAYTGKSNYRRPLVLPKGMKADTLSVPLCDQRLEEHIDRNRDNILAILKYPKHKVGLQTAGSLGSEEAKTALKNYWDSTVIPTCRIISHDFTNFFRSKKLLEPNQRLIFDFSDVEVLKENEKLKAEIATEAANILGVNAARARYYKEDDIDHPNANIPLLLLKKSSDKQTQPIIDDEETLVDDEETVIDDEEKCLRFENFLNKKFGFDVSDKIDKQFENEENTTGIELKNLVFQLFLFSLEKSMDILESQELVIDEEKKLKFIKLDKADIPSRRDLRSSIIKALNEFKERWENEYIRLLESSVDLGYDQGLSFIFNDKDANAVHALKIEGIDQRFAILEARGIESFVQISKTITNQIMNRIIQGVELGKTISQIAIDIQEFFDPKNAVSRANTIARTEVLTAVSIGQNAVALDIEKVIPGSKKAWLTVGDNRVRDSHRNLQKDKPIPIKSKFVAKDDSGKVALLSFPRDPLANAPDETINCRCSLVIITPDDNFNIDKEPEVQS